MRLHAGHPDLEDARRPCGRSSGAVGARLEHQHGDGVARRPARSPAGRRAADLLVAVEHQPHRGRGRPGAQRAHRPHRLHQAGLHVEDPGPGDRSPSTRNGHSARVPAATRCRSGPARTSTPSPAPGVVQHQHVAVLAPVPRLGDGGPSRFVTSRSTQASPCPATRCRRWASPAARSRRGPRRMSSRCAASRLHGRDVDPSSTYGSGPRPHRSAPASAAMRPRPSGCPASSRRAGHQPREDRQPRSPCRAAGVHDRPVLRGPPSAGGAPRCRARCRCGPWPGCAATRRARRWPRRRACGIGPAGR